VGLCKLFVVAFSEVQFRAGVVGAATLLVLGITMVRFCGDVSLPPKQEPLPVSHPTGTGQDLVEQSNASQVVYHDYLAKDARVAGVPTPTVEEMSRKLPYRVDEGRQVLGVGHAPIEVAGLRLEVKRSGNTLVLDIENRTASALAYHVVTEPTPKIAACNTVTPLQFNAMVIAKGEHQVRVECVWRPGMVIAVTRVESIEVPPLSVWYLDQVPPRQVGIEHRIARGHRIPRGADRCISLSSQAVRSGIENGEIQWRDLVDFYARHRCQTYQFPASYRALNADGQRRIPAT